MKHEVNPGGTRIIRNACSRCPGLCCIGISFLIVKPKSPTEIENLAWQIMHRKVSVYIRHHKWYLLYDTPCAHLDKDHGCREYENRPGICRRHNPPDCEFFGKYYDRHFTKPGQLLDYLQKGQKSGKVKSQKS